MLYPAELLRQGFKPFEQLTTLNSIGDNTSKVNTFLEMFWLFLLLLLLLFLGDVFLQASKFVGRAG